MLVPVSKFVLMLLQPIQRRHDWRYSANLLQINLKLQSVLLDTGFNALI